MKIVMEHGISGDMEAERAECCGGESSWEQSFVLLISAIFWKCRNVKASSALLSLRPAPSEPSWAEELLSKDSRALEYRAEHALPKKLTWQIQGQASTQFGLSWKRQNKMRICSDSFVSWLCWAWEQSPGPGEPGSVPGEGRKPCPGQAGHTHTHLPHVLGHLSSLFLVNNSSGHLSFISRQAKKKMQHSSILLPFTETWRVTWGSTKLHLLLPKQVVSVLP